MQISSRRQACLLGASLVLATPCLAQDRPGLLPPGWAVGHVRVEGHAHRHTASNEVRREGHAPRGERGLTIRREFAPAPDDEDDPLFDGATHYNRIRSFDPVPTIDSGRQLPYGLDGIGGFGSDMGFASGSDSAVYDRGP